VKYAIYFLPILHIFYGFMYANKIQKGKIIIRGSSTKCYYPIVIVRIRKTLIISLETRWQASKFGEKLSEYDPH